MMLNKSEHMLGWEDAILKLHPPAVATVDYIEGFKAGIRHRLKDVQDSLNFPARLPHIREYGGSLL